MMFAKTRSEIKRLNATKKAFKKLCSDCKGKAGVEALKGNKHAVDTDFWCEKCLPISKGLEKQYNNDVTNKVMEGYDEFAKREE